MDYSDLCDAVNLFSGAGGWEVGGAQVGIRAHGIELFPLPASSARAAGFPVTEASVADLDPRDAHGIAGLIASPPCQGVSVAGKGVGREDVIFLPPAVRSVEAGHSIDEAIAKVRRQALDDRSALLLEPLRWTLIMRPEWTVWEQVSTQLPVWRGCTGLLEANGYSVWTGNMAAERYGVPQTRARAVLIASRTRKVGEPPATHSRFHLRDPGRLDEGVKPWVSVAEALNWREPGDWVVRSNYSRGGKKHATAAQRGKSTRRMDQPSITVVGKPGHFMCGDVVRRISVPDTAVLQSFPADYPFQGNKEQRYQQIGNAVPPLLAAHVLAEASGRAWVGR